MMRVVTRKLQIQSTTTCSSFYQHKPQFDLLSKYHNLFFILPTQATV